ncbi:hypothetical protein ACX9NE_05205 [Mycobacterium sp. ML4]
MALTRSPRTAHRRLLATALVLVLVPLWATGCNHRPPSSPAPTTVRGPDDIDQTTSRWIDNPGIDLMSPEGTFVRATVESLVRASYGRGRGTEAIDDGGYPGFTRAFHHVYDPNSLGGVGDRQVTYVGTEYYEAVVLRQDTDRRYLAGYCYFASMTALKQPDGQYFSNGTGLVANYGAGWLTFGPDPEIPAERQRAPKHTSKDPRASRPMTCSAPGS